ncbi:hypothetical protein AC579_796 [Pseudocercospora musae]|uniref:Uncharacterized protein n=1 Tax=Pseudocercospora musae TaxID=113226 RepID=A0A139IH19_9PEZI|nr:hypothetical protein AC579_796 [Pseudocercospora musae]
MSDDASMALRAERKERLLRFAGKGAKRLVDRFDAPTNPYIREMAKFGAYDWQQARLDAGDVAPVFCSLPNPRPMEWRTDATMTIDRAEVTFTLSAFLASLVRDAGGRT